jgi:aminoglycoside phosphotransferase (APT) family kinase protein
MTIDVLPPGVQAGLRHVLPTVDRVERLVHPRQRNTTYLVHAGGQVAVAKVYTSLRPSDVDQILMAEHRVSQSGLPIPRLIARIPDASLVLHTYVHGVHRTAPSSSEITSAARHFVTAMSALEHVQPTWAPDRPVRLPYRARQALDDCRDSALCRAITDSWQQLCALADHMSVITAHIDWRSDNLIFDQGTIAGILDWESLARLPWAEAVGYAAGSLTHTWRDKTYQPVTVEPTTAFIEAIDGAGGFAHRGDQWPHVLAASHYTCAVRLAEDQARGVATTTVRELQMIFGR